MASSVPSPLAPGFRKKVAINAWLRNSPALPEVTCNPEHLAEGSAGLCVLERWELGEGFSPHLWRRRSFKLGDKNPPFRAAAPANDRTVLISF